VRMSEAPEDLSESLPLEGFFVGSARQGAFGGCALVRSFLLAVCVAAYSITATAAEAQATLPPELSRSDVRAQAPAPANSLSRTDEAEYRLNFGDVLEFSVRGFPDLRQKAMVELDGEVSVPLAGRVRVIGMPLS